MVTPGHDSDPSAVVTYLAPALAAVQEALDHGVSFADTVTANLKKRNPHLWADLVRSIASEDLTAKAKDQDWSVTVLLNAGMEVTRYPFTPRLGKETNGGPPSPGSNRARRDFWDSHHQQQMRFDVAPILGTCNLLLDWAITDDRSVALALSKPIGTWSYTGTPQLAWRQPVAIDDGAQGFAGADEDDLFREEDGHGEAEADDA